MLESSALETELHAQKPHRFLKEIFCCILVMQPNIYKEASLAPLHMKNFKQWKTFNFKISNATTKTNFSLNYFPNIFPFTHTITSVKQTIIFFEKKSNFKLRYIRGKFVDNFRQTDHGDQHRKILQMNYRLFVLAQNW